MLKKTNRRSHSNVSGSSSEPGRSASYESSFSSYSESFSVETDNRWWKAFEPVPRDEMFSEGSRSYEEEVSFETEYTGESEDQSQWDEELEIVDVSQPRAIHALKANRSNHSVHSSGDKSQKTESIASIASHTSKTSSREKLNAKSDSTSHSGQRKSPDGNVMEAMYSSENVEIVKIMKVSGDAKDESFNTDPRPSDSNSNENDVDSDGESEILFDEEPVTTTENRNIGSLWNNYSLWDRSPTSQQMSDGNHAPFSNVSSTGAVHEPQGTPSSTKSRATSSSPSILKRQSSGQKESQTNEMMQASQPESLSVESSGINESKTDAPNSSTSQSSKQTAKPRVKRLSKFIKSGISRRNPNNSRIPDELPMPPRNSDLPPAESLVSPKRRIPSNLPMPAAKSQTSSKPEQNSTSSISSSAASLHTYSVSPVVGSATAGSRSKTPVIQNYRKIEKQSVSEEVGNHKDSSSMLTRFANSESTFSQPTVASSETSSANDAPSTKTMASLQGGKVQEGPTSASGPIGSPSHLSPRKLWKLFKEKKSEETARPLRISGFDNSSGVEVERGFSPSKPPYPTYVQSVHTVTSLYDSEGQKVEGNSMFVITVEDKSTNEQDASSNSTRSQQTVSSSFPISYRNPLRNSRLQRPSTPMASEVSSETSTSLQYISTIMDHVGTKTSEVDSLVASTNFPMSHINLAENNSGPSELLGEMRGIEERDHTESSEETAKNSVALHRTRNLSVIDGDKAVKVDTKATQRVTRLDSEDELCVKTSSLTLPQNQTGEVDRSNSDCLSEKPNADIATNHKKGKSRSFRKKKNAKDARKKDAILLPFLDYNPFRMVFLAESEGRDELQSQRDGPTAEIRELPVEEEKAVEEVQMSLSPLGVEMTDDIAPSLGTDDGNKSTALNIDKQQVGRSKTPTFLRVPLTPLKSTKGTLDTQISEVLDTTTSNKKAFQPGKVLRTPLFRRKEKPPSLRNQELSLKPDGKTPKRRFFRRNDRIEEVNSELSPNPDVASVDVTPLVSYRRPNFEFKKEASPPGSARRSEVEDEQDLLSLTSYKTFLSADTKLSDKLLDRLATDMKLLEKIEKQRRMKGDESKSIATSMQLLKTVDELLKQGAAEDNDESIAESDSTEEEATPTSMTERIEESFMRLFSCHTCTAE